MKFDHIAADKRFEYMNERLLSEGFERVIYESGKDIDVLILSIPSFSKDHSVKNCRIAGLTLMDILSRNNPPKTIIGGMIREETASLCRLHGVKVYDITDKDDFAIANALPTAEAAVMIAMEELPVTVFGLDVLVTGYGRIARMLCSRLRALNANVTVAARKPSDRAFARAEGCETVDINNLDKADLSKFRLICNTVPALVITKEVVGRLDKSALVIDLASLPGGCDAEYISERGIRFIYALSLPGKYAPQTAGDIIASAVVHYAHEEEIN